MTQAITTQDIRIGLERATDLANDGLVSLAAHHAALATASAEKRLQQLHLSSGLTKAESDEWHKQLANASGKAAGYYEKLGGTGSGPDLPHLLTASEYWSVAARASGSSHRRDQFEDAALKCKELFDLGLAALPEAEQRWGRLSQIKQRLGLSAVNSADEAISARLDGVTLEERRDDRLTNCQRVVPATIATIVTGVPMRASARRGEADTDFSMASSRLESLYEWAYGGKFEQLTLPEVAERLQDAGRGSVGLLKVTRSDGAGHITTVANIDDLPLWVEGQVEQLALLGEGKQLPGERDAQYEFLMVRDASRDVLKVDERQRAAEIMRAIDGRAFGTDTLIASPHANGSEWPQSVRDAAPSLTHSSFAAAPDLQESLATARSIVAAGSAGATPLNDICDKLDMTAQRWGYAPGLGFDNRVAIRHSMSGLGDKPIALAVDGDGRSMLLTKIDGFEATIDVKTGGIAPGYTAKGELLVFDLSKVDRISIGASAKSLGEGLKSSMPAIGDTMKSLGSSVGPVLQLGLLRK